MNHAIPVIFVNENNFQCMINPVANTVPTKYVSEYTKGLDITLVTQHGHYLPISNCSPINTSPFFHVGNVGKGKPARLICVRAFKHSDLDHRPVFL